MRAAIFDLDGTLLNGTSAERLLVPFLVRRGVVGPRQILFALGRAAAWPVMGRTRAIRRNKRWLTGVDVSAVEALMTTFVREELGPRWNPLAVERLEALRASGAGIHLLTGAPDFVARAVGARWRADSVIATALDVVDGRFTGRIRGPHRFARAKRDALDLLASQAGLDLEDSWGFADHASDVPFLEALGNPVAVNPDRRLRRVARRRGWEVLRG